MEEKTVSLSLGTIIRECSLNPNLMKEHFYNFSWRNRQNIHDVFLYKKFNDDFVEHVDCFNDGKYIIGTIRPSYDEFLEKLVRLLNVSIKGKIKDDDDLTKRLLEKVEVLKKITNEWELKEKFPLLYKDLQDGRRYYNDLQKLRRQEGYSEEQYASGEHYYYSCALKKSLPNFIDTQVKLYTRFVTKRKELKEKMSATSFNAYIKNNFDLDKLYMYVMHEYLVKAESSKNREEIKKYINWIERYLTSARRKDISITTDSGMKVDYDNIVKRLGNLKRVVNDNSSLVDWIIIPEGRDLSKVRDAQQEQKVTLMTLEEMERLRQKGERKRAFYETTPYMVKALGLRRYHGYIAYIYDNGEVILDREYIPTAPSSATGDAIYNLKVMDFEELSKYDKQVLMHHPRVGRMNHTSTWEERVTKIIERPGTEDEKEEAKQLVKRLKEKHESK